MIFEETETRSIISSNDSPDVALIIRSTVIAAARTAVLIVLAGQRMNISAMAQHRL